MTLFLMCAVLCAPNANIHYHLGTGGQASMVAGAEGGYVLESWGPQTMPLGCVEVPEGCTNRYCNIRINWDYRAVDVWPYFEVRFYVGTGFAPFSPTFWPCDNEHGFIEYALLPQDTTDHAAAYDFTTFSGGGDLYLHYWPEPDSYQEWDTGWIFPSLHQVVLDDPGAILQPYNAVWLFSFMVNWDVPPLPARPDQSLICPNQDANGMIATMIVDAEDWGCPADFTGNGSVNADDFLFLLENYGSPFDAQDVLFFLSQFGTCPYT